MYDKNVNAITAVPYSCIIHSHNALHPVQEIEKIKMPPVYTIPRVKLSYSRIFAISFVSHMNVLHNIILCRPYMK